MAANRKWLENAVIKKCEKTCESEDGANNLTKSAYTDLPLRVRLTSISEITMTTYATEQKFCIQHQPQTTRLS